MNQFSFNNGLVPKFIIVELFNVEGFKLAEIYLKNSRKAFKTFENKFLRYAFYKKGSVCFSFHSSESKGYDSDKKPKDVFFELP